MDIKESSQMTADEEYSHWWMRTRFYFLNKIVTPFLREKKALRILEIGSGTGQNLRYFLSEHCLKNQIQEIVGVDTALQNKVQKYFWNSSVQCTGYQSLEDVSFSEKFDRYMENVVMPVLYRLAILFPFKQVLMGFVIINIFAVTLLSMFPMSTLMQESNLVEATKRAKSVARALAKFNEQALLTGQLGQLSVQEAMKEEGIREALIIQQSDGLIVAPAEKAGRDTSRSFVIQARKEGRSFSAKVDANTIGASHPIGVYDPLTGEPSVKYHAMVLYDVSSLNVDQERMISLFMQTLIIASLFGLLLYYLFSRMMDYPIRHLNQQIEKALLEQSDRTEVIYDYPIFQQLVSNVNTLLNRVWTAQSASTGGMSTQQNKDLELSHLVDMISTPACAVSNDDRLIAVNTSFEHLTQSSRETLVNQNYQSITDTSLVQNIESLIVRARQSPYEKHEDRIPFSQFECQIYCQAFLDSQGQPENFIFTLVQQQ